MTSRRCRAPRLFAAFLSAVAAAAAAAQHIVVGDVSTRDRDRPVYDVVLPTLGTPGSRRPRPDAELVRVVTARGQAMLCGVPPAPEERRAGEGGEGEDEGVPGVAGDESDPFGNVEELMDGYRGKCFRREEGWWQFIFCYGAYVEQRHVSTGKDDLAASYILGKLDSAFDEERRRSGGGRVAGGDGGSGSADGGGAGGAAPAIDPDAPYTQLFGNGTVCDINGQPREITVKYKCNKDAVLLGGTAGAVGGMEFIGALREPETCVYEIDFVNAAICNHPAYARKRESNLLSINCIMEDSAERFMGLASNAYRKATLNL